MDGFYWFSFYFSVDFQMFEASALSPKDFSFYLKTLFMATCWWFHFSSVHQNVPPELDEIRAADVYLRHDTNCRLAALKKAKLSFYRFSFLTSASRLRLLVSPPFSGTHRYLFSPLS